MNTNPRYKPVKEDKSGLDSIGKYILENLYHNEPTLSLSDYLIKQALLHKATDIHIDCMDMKVYMFFRIKGKLKSILQFDLQFGRKLIYEIKKVVGQTNTRLKKPWTGTINCTCPSPKSFPIHIIPFPCTDSIIIRLDNLSSAKIKKNPPEPFKQKVFIWQMGKVGSTTIFASLKPYADNTTWPDKTEQPTNCIYQDNIVHTHSALPIFNLMHKTEEDFVIISLVRDLLARNISSIFQSMTEARTDNKNFIAPRNEFLQYTYEVQEKKILEKLTNLNLDNSILKWYDNLFKSHIYYPDVDRYFIDIYGSPFNHKKGMQIYSSRTPRIKMLIICLEKLNNLECEIGNFLGIKNFSIESSNISKNKWYSGIYKKFLRRYKPSNKELEHIYGSKFMRYFYAQEQIDQFVSRWLQQT